jgi:hypothetical protein
MPQLRKVMQHRQALCENFATTGTRSQSSLRQESYSDRWCGRLMGGRIQQ